MKSIQHTFMYPVSIFFILSGFILLPPLRAEIKPDIVVALDGSGDFSSIQDAIDMVADNNAERIRILIKPGIYEEKLYIEKNCITLEGQDSSNTIIRYAVLRRVWREAHSDDWGAATVNLKASDFIMRNLSVINNYGHIYGDHDHQFAVRLMAGTRIIFENCRFISGGGDTVSLWDKEKGQYYHKNCHFEGYVDLLCPRGWCYVEGSTFYQHKKTATLWLDGSEDHSKRFVIKDSRFDGIDGFKLGRRHYDAQYILIDCNFSAAMADEPIYRVTYPDEPERDRPNRWGDRYYFFNCNREGGNYSWHADNIECLLKSKQSHKVTPIWTFNGSWDPEKTLELMPDIIK